jgi:hypothetical protein
LPTRTSLSFNRARSTPSLRLKKVGVFWSARVGLHFRVLAKERAEGLVWFWIGHHSEYDQLIKQ